MAEIGRGPTAEELQSQADIPEILALRYVKEEPIEKTRIIYNQAIDDAANFLRDVAPHNLLNRIIIEACSRSIRVWLTIPRKEESR